jgi:hypothetical protein
MNESDLERIMSHPRTKELINTTANTAFIDEKTGNTRIYSSQTVVYEKKHKRTSIGGGRVKTSTMNKHKKRTYKKYNRQGR